MRLLSITYKVRREANHRENKNTEALLYFSIPF